jgi:DNA-binding beta-propeller fold protein YncE
LTYWQDIRPVLRKHCTSCHSHRNIRDLDVSGGLAVDTYEAVRRGAKEAVIQPGKSSQSMMIQRVTSADEEKRMPLGAEPLPPEIIERLRRWIDQGALPGTPPSEGGTVTSASPARHRRRLDIRLPTNLPLPKALTGTGKVGRLELSLAIGPLSPLTAVAYSPDGKLLATGRYREVTIWNLDSVRPVKTLTNLLGAVNDLRFSPDGRLLAVAGGQPSAKGDLRIFRTTDWALQEMLPGHEDVVYCVAFHPDGVHLASASFDKTVRVWNLKQHKLEQAFTGHSDFVYSVAFSPDGAWLATASKDRSVRRLDAATVKSRLTMSGMNQDVLAVAVSPDGQNIVSAGLDNGIYWWNANTGQRLRIQRGQPGAVYELSFSKDGRYLASAGDDKTIRLWDGRTGGLLRTLPVGSIAYAVAVSPDGKSMASGSFDGFVRLWDSATGRLLATLLSVPRSGETPDWIALTPEGYEAASATFEAELEWRAADKHLSPELLRKAMEQPDALVQAVHGQKLAPPRLGK